MEITNMIMTVTIPGKQEKTYSMKNKNTNYKPTDEKREQKKNQQQFEISFHLTNLSADMLDE